MTYPFTGFTNLTLEFFFLFSFKLPPCGMLVIMKKGRLSLKIERKKTVMYSARLVDTGWMLHVRPGISYISLIQNSFVHRRGKEGPG